MCSDCKKKYGNKVMLCGMSVMMFVEHLLPVAYEWIAWVSAAVMFAGCIMELLDM